MGHLLSLHYFIPLGRPKSLGFWGSRCFWLPRQCSSYVRYTWYHCAHCTRLYNDSIGVRRSVLWVLASQYLRRSPFWQMRPLIQRAGLRCTGLYFIMVSSPSALDGRILYASLHSLLNNPAYDCFSWSCDRRAWSAVTMLISVALYAGRMSLLCTRRKSGGYAWVGCHCCFRCTG